MNGRILGRKDEKTKRKSGGTFALCFKRDGPLHTASAVCKAAGHEATAISFHLVLFGAACCTSLHVTSTLAITIRRLVRSYPFPQLTAEIYKRLTMLEGKVKIKLKETSTNTRK